MDRYPKELWTCLGIHNKLQFLKLMSQTCKTLNSLYTNDEFLKAKFCIKNITKQPFDLVKLEYTKQKKDLQPMSEEDKSKMLSKVDSDTKLLYEKYTCIKTQIQDLDTIRFSFKVKGKCIINIVVLACNSYFYFFKSILKLETHIDQNTAEQYEKIVKFPVEMEKITINIDYVYDKETNTIQCFLNDSKFREPFSLNVIEWFSNHYESIEPYKDTIAKQPLKFYLLYRIENATNYNLSLSSSPHSCNYVGNII